MGGKKIKLFGSTGENRWNGEGMAKRRSEFDRVSSIALGDKRSFMAVWKGCGGDANGSISRSEPGHGGVGDVLTAVEKHGIGPLGVKNEKLVITRTLFLRSGRSRGEFAKNWWWSREEGNGVAGGGGARRKALRLRKSS